MRFTPENERNVTENSRFFRRPPGQYHASRWFRREALLHRLDLRTFLAQEASQRAAFVGQHGVDKMHRRDRRRAGSQPCRPSEQGPAGRRAADLNSVRALKTAVTEARAQLTVKLHVV